MTLKSIHSRRSVVSHLTSIKTKISEKLGDAEYRRKIFRGQAEDEIAMSIKALREKRNKRQVDLAKDSGMKQSAVSRIEQADYRGWSLKTLFRVADALDARLRITFEPSETVIEHYRELEAGALGQDIKKQMEDKI